MNGPAKALLCAALSLGAGSVCAQETLYGKQAPRGSSYVRVVNTLADPVRVESNFQPEQHLGTAPADRVGQYVVVERTAERPLSLTVADGAASASLAFKAPPDSYVTLVLTPGADGKVVVKQIADAPDFNQTRARISFYNAAPSCAEASLTLQASGAAVFQGVSMGSVKSRTVNPVQAMVQAVCPSRPAGSLMLSGLEVGASYSVWLIGQGDEGGLFLVRDVSAPYKPQS